MLNPNVIMKKATAKAQALGPLFREVSTLGYRA